MQIPYIIIALTDGKMGAEGRKDIFDWLTKQLAGLSDFVDAIHLLKPASTAMTVTHRLSYLLISFNQCYVFL